MPAASLEGALRMSYGYSIDLAVRVGFPYNASILTSGACTTGTATAISGKAADPW